MSGRVIFGSLLLFHHVIFQYPVTFFIISCVWAVVLVLKRFPNSAGTIGPFVEYESEIAFLTCAHIIYGIDPRGYDFANPKIYIEQPPTSFSHRSQNRCGEVIKAVFKPNSNTSIDAALVLITDQQRLPKRGQFAIDNEYRYRDSGFDDMPVFNSGIVASHPNQGVNKRIVKFGASTHVTSGLLVCTGSVVRPLSHELQLYGNCPTNTDAKPAGSPGDENR
ncbi:uncharacterized protein LOC117315609 [Pecten maximus]|uniref:uncharacterized protein LOC117315609 n=1 Tax=Pecten maximus TaxID=6579 RepID=UPI0014589EBA|nr:uncharacterized protein LOC117315609 [Pecten maximus]